MNHSHQAERGQALILIVLSIVGMIGLVALAIDGGNAFSNRRSAQNAADSAALAGALAKVKSLNISTAALGRAASNNFNNDGTTNTVTVSNPPGGGCSGTVGTYDVPSEYVQVIIRTTISTYFAPVVGITQLHNCVEAIAHAKPGLPLPLCYKNLLCAVSCHDSYAFDTNGSSNVTLTGGGAFSNSDASVALNIKNNQSLVISSGFGASAVGGISAPYNYPSPLITGATPISCPLPSVMIPSYTCNYNVVDLPQGGNPNLAPGVYCVSGQFNRASYTGNGVTIVMLNNGFFWTGSLDVHLTAPTSGPTAGLLIYLPYGNTNTIRFRGSGNLDITGTIFAPDATIDMGGSYGTLAIKSQMIADNFTFGGSTDATIQFPPIYYQFPGDRSVELWK